MKLLKFFKKYKKNQSQNNFNTSLWQGGTVLINRGSALKMELREELIELGVFNGVIPNTIFLEDLLPIVLQVKPDNASSIHFIVGSVWNDNVRIILTNCCSKNEVEDSSFVNAAARFIIESINKGFLTVDWKDLGKIGAKVGNYDIRSKILPDRNYIKSIMNNYTKKK